VCSIDAMGCVGEFGVTLLSMNPGPPVILGARGALCLMGCGWKFCCLGW
jgi:hypothetical protein